MWLEPLGLRHAETILAGQDEVYAEEIAGARWERASLTAFLSRCEGWSPAGPIREFAAWAAVGRDDAGSVSRDAGEWGRIGVPRGAGGLGGVDVPRGAGGLGGAPAPRVAGGLDGAPALRAAVGRGAPSRMVGGGGVRRLAPGLGREQAALTYWVLADARGGGLGHAVASRIRDLAAQDARIRQLVLWIAPGNHASRAVATRLGAQLAVRAEPHPADARRTADRWVLDLG